MAIEGLGEPVALPNKQSEEEISNLNETLRLHPSVLNGLASDIGRRHQSLEGDYYMTPQVAIADDQLDVHATVRVGYPKNQVINTIYVVDDTGTRPWYTLDRETAMRGDGQIISDKREFEYIRALLDLTGQTLDAVVTQELAQFDRSAFFDERLAQEIEGLEGRLKKLKRIQAADSETRQARQRLAVSIRSGWAEYGEQNTTTEYSADIPLASAMVAAAYNFKQVNNRRDVQGDSTIIVQDGEASYMVPMEVWRRYFQMISGNPGFFEQSALDYAKTAADLD